MLIQMHKTNVSMNIPIRGTNRILPFPGKVRLYILHYFCKSRRTYYLYSYTYLHLFRSSILEFVDLKSKFQKSVVW